MSRFPKGLVLIAVLAELMILTVSSRTEIFSWRAEQRVRNVMVVAPALPNASVTGKQVRQLQAQKAKSQPASKVMTGAFKTAPHPVL